MKIVNFKARIQELILQIEQQNISIVEKSREMDNIKEEKEKIKEEFQGYKLKAQLALQQSTAANGMDTKVSELKETNEDLENQIK